MSTHAKTKITVNPQAQMVVSGGDNDITARGNTVCNMGCDLRIFLDHSGFCPDFCGKVEGILTSGNTAEPGNNYKSAHGTSYITDGISDLAVKDSEILPVRLSGENAYELAGTIDNTPTIPGDPHSTIGVSLLTMEKLLASLIYKCGVKSELDCQFGIAKTVQQDNCGRYQAGWYKCQSEYFGNAFEGFVNPFIWNKQTKGLQLTFRQGPLECWGHYGVVLSNAAEINKYSYGFADTDTPGECDAGICYRMEAPCPMRLSLLCQQLNNGKSGFGNDVQRDWLYRNDRIHNASGTLTKAAEAALAQSQEQSQYVNAFSACCDSEIQGVDLNCYLTCGNVKNTSQNTARILKWAIGCVSKCKPIKCLPLGGIGFGAQAFGINLGTPAYLSGDLKTTKNNTVTGKGDVTLTADSTPLVCEASCLFNFCGFNVPIFVDYMNRLEGGISDRSAEEGIYNVAVDTGSALICGLRPSRIAGLDCQGESTKCFDKYILDCRVEGGLDEDAE